LKVVHVVPCDGIGGVEIAAKKMLGRSDGAFQFELFYIADRNAKNFKTQLWSPLVFIKAAKQILKKNPDIILVSLWRSVILALMIKLVRPKIKFIYFLHSTTTRHFLDSIFTRLGVKFSDTIFGDSKISIDTVVPRRHQHKAKIISFVLSHHTRISFGEPQPTFIFWGRLNRNKNLVRALHIFADVQKVYPNAFFTIIGPDDGDLTELILLSKKLEIAENVQFTGGLDLEQIKQYAAHASFYLQTSDYEGMAMAVVEAMQMGLIPVVTRVGEISEYCKDGANSIIVNVDRKTPNRISLLLNDPFEFEKVRYEANATWRNKLLYSDSLVENLMAVYQKDLN
jgi:glycosyltransferase involved in cell wall biosynthesis